MPYTSPPSPLPGHYQAVPQDVSSRETGLNPTLDQSDENSRLSSETMVSRHESPTRQSLENTNNVQDNHPRFIKQGLDVATLLTDIATIVSPLLLLGFAAAVAHLDGSEVEPRAFSRWENAITVLATIFPILFASTVGRLVYEIARWKLEKGSTLGSLEQLMGSRTVGATLLTQFNLRMFNLLGMALLLTWSFSPLGTQSLLRMLRPHLHPRMEPSSIVYFDTDGRSRLVRGISYSGDSREVEDFETSLLANWYNSLLLAPETAKTGAIDLWGGVKIPFLSQEDGREPDSDGWTDVASSPDLSSYSSFAGLLVANVSVGNTTFSLESSYLSLDCSMTQVQSYNHSELGVVGLSRNFTHTNSSPMVTPGENGTWYGFHFNRTLERKIDATWSIAVDRFVDSYWLKNLSQRPELRNFISTPALFRDEVGIQVEPTTLLFQAMFAWHRHSPRMVAKAYCDTRQEYVESRVKCSRTADSSGQNCSVIAQRPSRRLHAPPSILHFSFPAVFAGISEDLPLATGSQMGSQKPDLSLRYLIDPEVDNRLPKAGFGGSFANMSNSVFSRRLSQLLNTYFLLSQSFFQDTAGDLDIGQNISTPVEIGSLVEIYDVSTGWIALFFLSCIVLLLSGVFNVAFTHMADGPEILGYASTVIRDSKFVDVQTLADGTSETGAMGAIDLALVMKNERVRYGFVDSALDGKSKLGVGREEQTQRIKNYLV